MPPQEPPISPDPYTQLPHDETGIDQGNAVQTGDVQYGAPVLTNYGLPTDQSPQYDAPTSDPWDLQGASALSPPPVDEGVFVSPQLGVDEADLSYRRRLVVWWAVRVAIVLIVVGVLASGGYGVYYAITGGGGSKQASLSGLDSDGSKAPISEWECAKGEEKDPSDDKMCIGEKDALIPLEEVYGCSEGFTKIGAGETTTCEKPAEGAEVLTEDPEVAYSCPAGFEEGDSERSCVKNIVVNASLQRSCPAGSAPNGGNCKVSAVEEGDPYDACESGWTEFEGDCIRTAPFCPAGYQPSEWLCSSGSYQFPGACPEHYTYMEDYGNCRLTTKMQSFCRVGYTQAGSGAGIRCSRVVISYVEYNERYSCQDGFSPDDTVCRKREVQPAKKTYACPAGYVSSGSKCQQIVGGNKVVEDPTTGEGCRDGYEMTDDGSQCRRISAEPREGRLIQVCDRGWELKKTDNGPRCYKKKS